MKNRQYLLMIMDGVGLNDEEKGNAFKLANTPNIDKYISKYPNTYVATSGMAVGLPEGQMGNSEVGHTNIGAGRIVYQELTRITKEINEGKFFENSELKNAMDNAKKEGKALHIVGLLSDGGVHSHIDHLFALLKMAKNNGLENVYVHAILDGRDTPPTSAIEYVKELEEKMKEIGIGKIATLTGRYYAMDRDNRWERVKLAYDAMANGIGNFFKTAQKAIETSYEIQEFDEFVKPIVMVGEDGKPLGNVKNGDSIIYFNFRPDRARELTKAFMLEDFNGFEREKIQDLTFVTMTKYDDSIKNVGIAYKPVELKNTLGEYLSNNGYTQLRIAETEKYAHVTFFFNGGKEEPYNGEGRILVPSPKVATYDLKPEMSAYEVTDNVVEAIDSKKYDVIIINYANGDMVGHTGNLEKTIEAVEALDKCVGRVISKIEEVGGEALITADHGNCEYMLDLKTGEPITSHSTFDVPFIVVSNRIKSLKNGRLCDIAPTLLTLMDEKIPEEMSGESLIEIEK
ncbi:2 3-bisphosphoglycerate-independent phosphoglycerate mutase [Clostridium sp. CAG:921]|nr:2 3-bisphosphoglycerate-independent phosphoglycerate mutase [Clostridium sp. CAG:921]